MYVIYTAVLRSELTCSRTKILIFRDALKMDETLKNVIFLAITGFVAFHGLTYRDEEGESDFVRLLFGCIALMFFLRVFLVDVLGLDLF
jgi:hypothetical protein